MMRIEVKNIAPEINQTLTPKIYQIIGNALFVYFLTKCILLGYFSETRMMK